MTEPLQSKLTMNQYMTEDDVIQASIENKKPSLARDFSVAKMILQQRSEKCGDNLYDHLSVLLSKVIDERPQNVMDYFEEFSRKISQEKIKNENVLLVGTYVEPERLKSARAVLPCMLESFLFNKNEGKSERITDFTHLQFYWSLAGYGLPKAQIFAFSCSIGILENNPIIRNCRFWGRIFGLRLNYYIAEADLSDEEIKKRADGEVDYLNRKVYFVNNCLGDDWIELPNLTQEQIAISEKIVKYFTGDLNADVQSVPKFHGKEKNLLRAVIHRITTDTYVAPVGCYKTDEGSENATSLNSDYTQTEQDNLLDPSAWNHYRMITNENQLTLCSENPSQSLPLWTIRRVQEHFPTTSMVVIRSNSWPGALSFTSQCHHDSIYMGWGVKYCAKAHVPSVPLTVQKEYDFHDTEDST